MTYLLPRNGDEDHERDTEGGFSHGTSLNAEFRKVIASSRLSNCLVNSFSVSKFPISSRPFFVRAKAIRNVNGPGTVILIPSAITPPLLPYRPADDAEVERGHRSADGESG